MWACALGHQSAAVLLYRWSSVALMIPDSLGRLPLAVARSRGHTRLARCLEELHTHTHLQTHTPEIIHTHNQSHTLDTSPPPQLPLSPLSTSPDTGKSLWGTHTLLANWLTLYKISQSQLEVRCVPSNINCSSVGSNKNLTHL